MRFLSTFGGLIASSSFAFIWTEKIETALHLDRLYGLFVAGGPVVGQALHDEILLAWLRRTCRLTRNVFRVGEGRHLLEAVSEKRHLSNTRGAEVMLSRAAEFAVGRKIMRSKPIRSLNGALGTIDEEVDASARRWVTEPLKRRASNPFGDIIRRREAYSVSEKIQASARWLGMNGHRQVGIDEAARIAVMSERNFLRRFKAELGLTPSDYLLYVRLDMACRMLAETTLPVGAVALRCGAGSGGQLAKLFRKHIGKTPTAYRVDHRQEDTLE
ncbi:helix-turn-helix domain-containing protein [Paraburkholderia humisilvae]|uniref:HTH-type transcriptional activator RhaS n=1 Tax=Paraburkholderia humisilvae TaxID=627669 RepID=A0A6J5F2K0_9BURK|nr:helix-turn-helix domain-containing protein [Paraburkholderia humisilvae]CAB3773028.1 HTH-type transcriptional activator RhaS [Paraburkholderia humisilvae]